ncbi:hypothetical protein WICPIJ_002771 [Wickerhamomyces pijperi]|uniref:SAP domain-containing protein n=1 Tax=Wickerhamomyces pijperi TaxID=599730 RepID=A0A9P8QB84_WICPI|nr:hypothetical protein WICPIJ_002771 [Wickerhamomyces pijperi]
MSLKRFSKPQLAELAFDLGINSVGTKQVLETRILEHLDDHPELEDDDRYTKIINYYKSKSPAKASQESTPDADVVELEDSEEEEEDEEEEKATENVADDDEEEVEIEVELVERSDLEDGEEERELLGAADEDDDEEDAEYVPGNFGLTKFQDCLIEKYEKAYDCVQGKFDCIANTVSSGSSQLKEQLSSVETVNYLTTATELAVLLYDQVPLVELQEASFLDQSICSKYYGTFIQPDFQIVDIAALFQVKFVFTLATWFLLSYALPSIGAYYFNFATKKFTNSKYDPLSFNLVKLILAYFFLNGNVPVSAVKNDVKVFAAERGLLQASICNHLKAHWFHSSIVLRLVLDRLPFLNGFIGILVALYVAVIGN